MNKKMVIQNELVKVKGRVKAVTVRKEDFYKFLVLTKLRVFDKTYDVLMPPIDDMKKNTIDLNGLAVVIQYSVASVLSNKGSSSSTSPAQIVFTTSSGSTVTLPYSSQITPNSQGVTVFLQIFEASGNLTFQFYFIGFDTTDSSYSVTQAELYASAWAYGAPYYGANNTFYYTPLTRIAYTNVSITKTSTEYLFLVWLIEFENVPPYASFAVPIFQNALGLVPVSSGTHCNVPPSSSFHIYFYNGNCSLECSGNCPSDSLKSFIIYTQDNNLILELPSQAPLQGGTSTLEVLLCITFNFTNTNGSSDVATISGNTSATVTPPTSGATFYVAIVTIAITYSVS